MSNTFIVLALLLGVVALTTPTLADHHKNPHHEHNSPASSPKPAHDHDPKHRRHEHNSPTFSPDAAPGPYHDYEHHRHLFEKHHKHPHQDISPGLAQELNYGHHPAFPPRKMKHHPGPHHEAPPPFY